jgi:urease accessory protein
MLAVLPDAMCCFAGSRYSQEQRIDLAPGASLALCDWVTAGRCAFGERWAFLRYHSKLVVCREGRRIVHDALLLDPEDGPLHAGGLAGRLGRFEALGTIVLCGPLLLAAAGTLLDEVAGMPLSRRAEVLLSAGPVPGGAILRLAATSAERLALALRHALRALPVFLGDDPWARKF